MNRLLKIVQEAVPGTGHQFRETAYGLGEIPRFLRDVIAMANAAVEGARYIVTGVGFDGNGRRRLLSVDREDFYGEPPYEALVAEFIEPPVRISYWPVMIGDRCVGVYEIGDCQDRPYMMRIDHSAQLRRGDAYARVDEASVKVGRRTLLKMLDKRPQRAVTQDAIEIGFTGDVMRKELCVPTIDMRRLPSMVERGKLNEFIAGREKTRDSGSTTTMARLMHMRLFGPDIPYEDRSPTGLNQELDHVDQTFESEDQWFLFEENAQKLQFAVYSQGDSPVQNASLTLRIPDHEELCVATRVPARPGDDAPIHDGGRSMAEYPAVSIRDGEIYVASTLGEIPAAVPVDAFESPLRICAGTALDGKRLTIRYRLSGSNLGQPVDGRLVLTFQGAGDA
jgi:hypothetical protein